MITKIVWATLLLVLSFSVMKMTEWTDSLREGGSFLQGRHYLLSHGWQGVVTDKTKEMRGNELTDFLTKAHIEEVESCAMDRLTCIFKYKKKKQCLKVIADTDDHDVKKMKVIKIASSCTD